MPTKMFFLYFVKHSMLITWEIFEKGERYFPCFNIFTKFVQLHVFESFSSLGQGKGW